MKREVISKRDVEKYIQETVQPYAETTLGTSVVKVDDYQSKLLKYIPTEVVALYLTLDGIIKSATEQLPQQAWLWIIFLVLLIGTPLYLWRVTKVKKKMQLIISTIAFAFWIFALGGPFTYFYWYKPLYGAILLPLYTFFVPIIEGN